MIKFKYYKTLATYNNNINTINNDDIVFVEGDNTIRTHGHTYSFTPNAITSETDPIFSASAAAGITSTDIANWNSKTSNTGTITGSGTNNYLVKWTGGSSITGLVALSSAVSSQTLSTKFLREDGTWAAPSYTSNDGNTQYYLTLNGSTKGTSGTTNLGTIYAPTTAGTSGYYLKSSGSGAPTWQQFPTIPTNTNQLTNGAGFISSVPSGYKKSYAVVVSVNADINNEGIPSGVTLNDGEECTVIYQNSGSADYTVSMATSGFVTQDGNALELTCPNGGYCEVNFLKIGSTVYLRGV